MIAAFRKHFHSMFSSASKTADSSFAAIVATNSRVRATVKSLIALHQMAHSVPLYSAKILSAKSGSYISPFKGRGMEYESSRPYQPGDDVRNLDWRVTARSGKTYTKQYREERERVVLMWVDYRSSMMFGTQGMFKSVMAARAAALLSWSAVKNGDKVGGLIFDDKGHQELRPQGGDKAVLHFIKKLCAYPLCDVNTMITPPAIVEKALLRLRRVTKPGSLIILLSDFQGFGHQEESHLMQLSRHNNVIMLYIYDPIESELPPAGLYQVSNGEQSKTLDTTSVHLRTEHQVSFQRHSEYLKKISRRYGASLISCATNESIINALQQGLRLKK